MNQRNFQKELDRITKRISENPKEAKPSLLLHVCCAPCSSYCLEYLSQFFQITVLYYNPNITPAAEYEKRIGELRRFVREAGYEDQITLIEGNYDPQQFFHMAKGMEDLPERSERCYHCYELRMREAAKYAAAHHMDYFTTSLSISPHKNAHWINEIGERLAEEFGVSHLPSDFKKKSGYLRSIALSKQYQLYRQDYCGCIFSKQAKAREQNTTL